MQAEKTQTNVTGPGGMKRSVVDTLFDSVTLQTAKGLVVAKDALETLARWLDARAKLVGDLATKLASTTTAEAGTTSTGAEETSST